MQSAKVKNIVILVLAAVNLCLLILVLPKAAEQRRIDREMSAQIVALFEENNILADARLIPAGGSLRPVTVVRDTQMEQRTAELLLGRYVFQDLGGGIYTYTGVGGSLTFRAGGEFEAVLSRNSTQGLFTPKQVTRLLKKLGVSYCTLTQTHEGDKTLIAVVQTVGGTEVYGETISLVYGESGLESVYGRRYAENGLSYGRASQVSAATALLRFLNSRDELGYVCQEITGLRMVYIRSGGATESALVPVWVVTTDAGEFRIDFATLQVSRVS